MSIPFGKESLRSGQESENDLTPPRGWFTAEELRMNYVTNENESARETQGFITDHLPMAAKRTERLIDAIEKKLNIEVPESYLRIRVDAGFQVLLLVKQADFVSPKMAAARLLAEEFADTGSYDINFTFSVQSEAVVNNAVLPNEYKLKHVHEHLNAPKPLHMY